MKISLLIRSYNRPSYLKKTLESVLESDIDNCFERIIYDDGSDNPEINTILNNPHYVKRKNKEFKVIKSSTNQGCKISYVKALDCISCDTDYICTIDNDVIVKMDFMKRLQEGYKRGYEIYKTHNILLTGFNPTNAHLNHVESYDIIYRKISCGAINWFFHTNIKQYVIDNWNVDLDWGVVNKMKVDNYPIICLNKGIVNHIGRIGNNSSNSFFDVDNNFNIDCKQIDK